MPAKRLWYTLVQQETVRPIFLHYAFKSSQYVGEDETDFEVGHVSIISIPEREIKFSRHIIPIKIGHLEAEPSCLVGLSQTRLDWHNKYLTIFFSFHEVHSNSGISKFPRFFPLTSRSSQGVYFTKIQNPSQVSPSIVRMPTTWPYLQPMKSSNMISVVL